MIDTDKYEGHTPADDWEKHLADALFETEFPMTYQDNQLMADAPLLLEEVKRLRKGMKMMLDDMKFSKPEEDIEYWLDTWKHWLKELIE